MRWRVGADCLRVEARVQVWTSDALGEDWELERAVDAAQGGSRTVRLRGPDGIVDIVVSSFLGDLMQPLCHLVVQLSALRWMMTPRWRCPTHTTAFLNDFLSVHAFLQFGVAGNA